MRKAFYILLSVMILLAAAAALGEDQVLPQNIAVGNIITLGHYEQDNNLDNGPEAIEWMVLDVQDGKALLLSKYGLEARPYNTEDTDITWETCTVRAWLNNEFLNEAFSAEEQSAILLTEVDNSEAQGFDWTTVGKDRTTGGNNTQDKVFLLSYAEANKYLDVQHGSIEGADQNLKSRAAPTAYAIKTGAYTNNGEEKTADGEPAGWWWLRSPGYHTYSVAYVRDCGCLSSVPVHYGYGVVRPAFWLDLESGIF